MNPHLLRQRVVVGQFDQPVDVRNARGQYDQPMVFRLRFPDDAFADDGIQVRRNQNLTRRTLLMIAMQSRVLAAWRPMLVIARRVDAMVARAKAAIVAMEPRTFGVEDEMPPDGSRSRHGVNIPHDPGLRQASARGVGQERRALRLGEGPDSSLPLLSSPA